jgi:hypothetical protein
VGDHGTVTRLHRELVLLIAADAVFATDVLGGLDHAADNRIVCAPGSFAGAVDGRCLTAGVTAAEDDVVDVAFAETCPFDECLQDLGGQFGCREGR